MAAMPLARIARLLAAQGNIRISKSGMNLAGQSSAASPKARLGWTAAHSPKVFMARIPMPGSYPLERGTGIEEQLRRLSRQDYSILKGFPLDRQLLCVQPPQARRQQMKSARRLLVVLSILRTLCKGVEPMTLRPLAPPQITPMTRQKTVFALSSHLLHPWAELLRGCLRGDLRHL